jgi:CubicO group peptidase (beta-lactamase class C family)
MCHSLLLILLFVFVISSSGQTGTVDSLKLARLLERGRETNSDALIVIQNGKVLVEQYYGKQKGAVYIASAGKSLTALAVGKLLDQGKIKSLDQPVSDFYPEWLQGRKKLITIRMLLNHTSGIQNVQNAGVEIERKMPPVNAAKLALAAELSNVPGTNWEYNNKAVGLLGGVIERASGKRMDVYFEEEFYKPMNIREFDWIRDEDGNPAAYGGHVIEPMGLAKFGLLMLDGGQFDGKQILSRSFVEEVFKPSQTFLTANGLLWWRYPKFSKSVIDSKKFAELRKNGIGEEFLQKLQPLENVVFELNQDYVGALEKALGKDWRQQVSKALENTGVALRNRLFSDEIVGYYASGFRGNYLLVMPKEKIVAVRVVRNDADYKAETDGFHDFLQSAAGLSGQTVSAPPFQ